MPAFAGAVVDGRPAAAGAPRRPDGDERGRSARHAVQRRDRLRAGADGRGHALQPRGRARPRAEAGRAGRPGRLAAGQLREDAARPGGRHAAHDRGQRRSAIAGHLPRHGTRPVPVSGHPAVLLQLGRPDHPARVHRGRRRSVPDLRRGDGRLRRRRRIGRGLPAVAARRHVRRGGRAGEPARRRSGRRRSAAAGRTTPRGLELRGGAERDAPRRWTRCSNGPGPAATGWPARSSRSTWPVSSSRHCWSPAPVRTGRRRGRREIRLLVTRGVGRGPLALKAVLETLPATVLGRRSALRSASRWCVRSRRRRCSSRRGDDLGVGCGRGDRRRARR